MKDYRNNVPLQPSSHRFLRPLLKSVHVLEQKKVVHQTLGNTTPFTFIPNLHISTHEEWLAVQLKLRLPHHCCLGKGCHTHLDLDLRLLNDNTTGWPRGSPGHCISRTGRSMFGNALPLSGSSGLGRRWGGRRLTLALRWLLLRGLPCTRHKTVYGHGLLGHHISTRIRFSIRKVSNTNDNVGALGSTGFSGYASSSWTGASSLTGA